ncbi:hypothetical protein PR048_007842 [Dryococelus australis]|uniref:DDE Tnp4 domain-containing protein n=1 Tax=Dryococelus australis TaxID=614101 RepID=A0ABQ9HVS0_9NEOP|nr:hypothetical protein PR048_007842 [Dryococelus australis]
MSCGMCRTELDLYDHSGSNNFNHLHYFSAVLMAFADAYALFFTIDVGAPGIKSAGGVFRASRLGRWLATESLNISAPAPLPGDETGTPIPYYFCAYEAFPSRENIIGPLSRACKSLECAFGLMCMKWQIFEKKIQCAPYNLNVIVQAACVLLYFTRIREGAMSIPDNLEYQKPHVTCIDDDRTGRAKRCHWREILANYFVHFSPIPYQWAHVVGESAEAAAMFPIFYHKQNTRATSLQRVVLKQLLVREFPGSCVAVSLQFPSVSTITFNRVCSAGATIVPVALSSPATLPINVSTARTENTLTSCAIWRRAVYQKIDAPSPNGHSCKQDADGFICIKCLQNCSPSEEVLA